MAQRPFRQAEMLRREESTQQKHLAEMAQQRQELDEFKSRDMSRPGWFAWGFQVLKIRMVFKGGPCAF